MRKKTFFSSTALTLSLASFSALAFHGGSGAGTSGEDVMPVPDNMLSRPAADTDGAGGSYGPGVVLGRTPAVGAPARGPTLSSLDTNNDGLISRSEAESAPDVMSQFSRLDKNGDGFLSSTEYDALGAPPAGGVSMSSLDRDGDGYISRSEAESAPDVLSQFSRLDKNGDGFLSASEYRALGAPVTGGVSISSLDKNHDGYVSRSEASSDPDLKSRFSKLDKDRDGYLSANELSAAYGAPGGGGVVGEEELEPSWNLPAPSDTGGRGDAYSDVESHYRNFPDIKSLWR